jgi:hypothetical protein
MKLRKADILFIIMIPAVVLCLWLLTTEQTTLRIPLDDDHRESLQAYRTGGKKAAEQVCGTCHSDEGLPLSEDHPPKYRCMFCHKPASPDLSSKKTGGP